MLKVISKISIDKVASTYVGYVRNNKKDLIEFVDSTPPPESDKKKKWVIIVSSQIGCPLRCRFCDASSYFRGNLRKEEILSQVNHILGLYPAINPNRIEKFKIQFARMGEPSLNPEVIDAMLTIREKYPQYIPCIATTAPLGSERFFERLLEIKDHFADFQLQFSVNSTDSALRDKIMPFKKQSLKWISRYSERFYSSGKRKVVLNFALSCDSEIDYDVIGSYFNPKICIIKLTPVNPTRNAVASGFNVTEDYNRVYSSLKTHSENLIRRGFQSIISIGDMRENTVLSNCGQIANILATAS